MSLFKKIIASIVLVSFIFANVTAPIAHAQTWYFQDYTGWHARVYDGYNPAEIFGERYTAAQVEWVIYGLIAFIMNHIVGSGTLLACIAQNPNPASFAINCWNILEDTLQAWLTAGWLGSAPPQGSSVANASPLQDLLSGNRPVSGIGYVRNALAKFSLVQEAKAQGFGFEAASSIRQLWLAVRNLTYFFLIFLIIAMSFMIMFRFKISPQTVITVQSALPRVIIALLLITFSYAIAGFMIDLLYVVIGIIAAALVQSGLFSDPSWANMYSRLAGYGFVQGLQGIISFYLLIFAVVGFFALISGNLLAAIGSATGVTEIIWIIILVILYIALIIIYLKILWMLMKTFVTILLLIATGPIFILVGGFGGWIRNLASNLAVFAAIGPMLAVAFLFLASALPDLGSAEIAGITVGISDWLASIMPFSPAANIMQGSAWIPPFLNLSGNLDLIWLFASFVVITLIPNVANIIKSLISGRPFGYGTAVGAALGAGAGVAWAPFGSQIAATKDSWAKLRGSQIIGDIQEAKYGAKLRRFLGV